jgi:hypothetical protein
MLFECAMTPGDHGTTTQKTTRKMILVEKSIFILRNSEIGRKSIRSHKQKIAENCLVVSLGIHEVAKHFQLLANLEHTMMCSQDEFAEQVSVK